MSFRSSRVTAVALVTLATFTDILAYSIAVPVLPDLGRRLGASPTMIGLLFASFGVTLLGVSVPMGAISDRIGRKAPMVSGLAALAAASLLFAFSEGLPWLFAARLVQGAADAVTWVVGFALIADLYDQRERGRITGIIMSGTSFSFMIGPSLGGWLYEAGGIRLPFLAVAALAAFGAIAFSLLQVSGKRSESEPVPLGAVLRDPAVATCAVAVLAASATTSMFEPVVALHLQATLGLGPARIGLVFAAAAVANTLVHPLVGRAVDRWGGQRLTAMGLVATALVLPIVARSWSFESTIVVFVIQAAALALMITPSLSYMADATAAGGLGSFGVAYGIYNTVWGAGLLGGPALGGFLFERLGFPVLALVWSPAVILVAVVVARALRSQDDPRKEMA